MKELVFNPKNPLRESLILRPDMKIEAFAKLTLPEALEKLASYLDDASDYENGLQEALQIACAALAKNGER